MQHGRRSTRHAVMTWQTCAESSVRPWPFQGQLLHGPQHSSAQGQSPVLATAIQPRCAARTRRAQSHAKPCHRKAGVLPAAKASESTSSAVHRTPDLTTPSSWQKGAENAQTRSVAGRSRRAVRCWRSISCWQKHQKERLKSRHGLRWLAVGTLLCGSVFSRELVEEFPFSPIIPKRAES